jgi:hypothetical protein
MQAQSYDEKRVYFEQRLKKEKEDGYYFLLILTKQNFLFIGQVTNINEITTTDIFYSVTIVNTILDEKTDARSISLSPTETEYIILDTEFIEQMENIKDQFGYPKGTGWVTIVELINSDLGIKKSFDEFQYIARVEYEKCKGKQ